MRLKKRIERAEQKAGTGEEKVIYIVRHAHDYGGPIEELPHVVSQVSDVTIHRHGITTVPDHLRSMAV